MAKKRGAKKKYNKRKNDPVTLGDTAEMLSRFTELHLQNQLVKRGVPYPTSHFLTSQFDVTETYFRNWAASKKIRKYADTYNVHDLQKVLIESLRQKSVRADVYGSWEEWGRQFYLGEFDVFLEEPPTPIYISSKKQSDGKLWWAVSAYVDPCWVMTKELEWVFEPEPIKRKIAYLRLTRFQDKEDALDYFCRFLESVKMIGEYDLNQQKIEE